MLHGSYSSGGLSSCYLLVSSFYVLVFQLLISQNLLLHQDLRATQAGIHNVNMKSRFSGLIYKILHCLPIIVLPTNSASIWTLETSTEYSYSHNSPYLEYTFVFATSSFSPSSNSMSSNKTSQTKLIFRDHFLIPVSTGHIVSTTILTLSKFLLIIIYNLTHRSRPLIQAVNSIR